MCWFLLFEGFQRTEFIAVMPIDAVAGNDPIANIACLKCGKKVHYRKDCPNLAGTSSVPDQTSSLQKCSPSMTVTQTVTAFYSTPQSNWYPFLKTCQYKANKL